MRTRSSVLMRKSCGRLRGALDGSAGHLEPLPDALDVAKRPLRDIPWHLLPSLVP